MQFIIAIILHEFGGKGILHKTPDEVVNTKSLLMRLDSPSL